MRKSIEELNKLYSFNTDKWKEESESAGRIVTPSEVLQFYKKAWDVDHIYNLFNSGNITSSKARELVSVLISKTVQEETQEMKKMLKFLSERLVNIYGENPNLDYIMKSRGLVKDE